MVLEEAKKIGLEDRNLTEEMASAQVRVWERSVNLEHRELAFVAEAQEGGGKGTLGPIYSMLSIK